MTPEESAKIRKSYEDAVKQWRKRKRLVCAVTPSAYQANENHLHVTSLFKAN